MTDVPVIRRVSFREYRFGEGEEGTSYEVVLSASRKGHEDYDLIGNIRFSNAETAYSFAMSLTGRNLNDRPPGSTFDKPIDTDSLHSVIEISEVLERQLTSDAVNVGTKCVVLVRDGEEEDFYHEHNVDCQFSPVGLAKAISVAAQLEEARLPTTTRSEQIVGFEWHNRVYRKGFVNLVTKHVIGISIDGFQLSYHYDEHEGIDETVDADYLNSDVHFHYRDIVYVVMGQFYMNGEKQFSVKQLSNMIPEYYHGDNHKICMLSAVGCDYFPRWLSERFPEATGYSCGGSILSLKNRSKLA